MENPNMHRFFDSNPVFQIPVESLDLPRDIVEFCKDTDLPNLGKLLLITGGQPKKLNSFNNSHADYIADVYANYDVKTLLKNTIHDTDIVYNTRLILLELDIVFKEDLELLTPAYIYHRMDEYILTEQLCKKLRKQNIVLHESAKDEKLVFEVTDLPSRVRNTVGAYFPYVKDLLLIEEDHILWSILYTPGAKALRAFITEQNISAFI